MLTPDRLDWQLLFRFLFKTQLCLKRHKIFRRRFHDNFMGIDRGCINNHRLQSMVDPFPSNLYIANPNKSLAQ